MVASTVERSPLFYARLAGTIYLVAMALSMFTQVYVPAQVLVAGDAAATARNLVSRDLLFRAGIVVDILIFVSDVVIAWAFYQLLKRVDDAVALLAAWLRVADAAILAAVTLNGMISVRLVSGVDYLQGLDARELQGLARVFMNARGVGLEIGFVFLGAGSTLFAYLLYRSRYVPRLISGWGVFASLLLSVGALGTLLSPWFATNLSMITMVPMFFFEVPLGIWLLVRGVKVPAGAPAW
jgi:hypothetical protein